jgi:hypothetical protein
VSALTFYSPRRGEGSGCLQWPAVSASSISSVHQSSAEDKAGGQAGVVADWWRCHVLSKEEECPRLVGFCLGQLLGQKAALKVEAGPNWVLG